VDKLVQSTHYFIGLAVPEEHRASLSTWRSHSEEVLPFKKWTESEDYHITLAFLGSVSDQQKKVLVEYLANLSATHSGFDLQTSSLRWFGRPEHPRILWLGVRESAPLNGLQREISSVCEHLGLRLDKRPYCPHITIAKQWMGPAAFPNNLYKAEHSILEPSFSFHAGEFGLFQIHLDRTPRYEQVQTFELAKGE
jgi:2'-5' RNA ligase